MPLIPDGVTWPLPGTESGISGIANSTFCNSLFLISKNLYYRNLSLSQTVSSSQDSMPRPVISIIQVIGEPSLIKRPICCAGAVILAFFIHTIRIPAGRAEDFLLRYIMHTYRNTKHGTQRNDVCAYMTVTDRAVVGPPVIHHIICRLKRTFSIYNRSKPCTRPCIVRPFPDMIRNLIRKFNCIASAICITGPTPFTMFRRIIVAGISAFVRKREE